MTHPSRKRSIVPQASTLTVRVKGLFNHLGEAQTDATVQVTAVVDKFSEEAIAEITVPITLNYVADWESRLDKDGNRVFDVDGNYEGSIPDENGMQASGFYLATIKATSSGGIVRTFRETLEVNAGEA